MSEKRRSIQVAIGDREDPVGIMTITCNDSGYVNEYLECGIRSIIRCTTNVPIYEDEVELTKSFIGKDQDPMVLLRRDSFDSPNIYLLEDMRYYLEFKKCSESSDITEPLAALRDTGADIEEVPIENMKLFAVRFAGYVGRGSFDVIIDDVKYLIPFEVRCSKIEYIKQYPQMLSDISEFMSSLLFFMKSPLSSRYAVSNDASKTYYEDFFLIESIFSKMGLEDAFSHVCNNIHRGLIMEQTESYGCDAFNVDPGSLYQMSMGGRIVSHDGGSIGGTYEFTVVVNNEYRETYDTVENRMVKDLLMTLEMMLVDMKDMPPEGYIKASIGVKIGKIRAMLSEPWLKEVGELDTIPFGSNLLMSAYGYSNLFEMYMILGLSVEFRSDDARFLLEGNINKVSQTYEYWCYIRLFNALCDLSGHSKEYEGVIQKEWRSSIKGDRPVSFDIKTGVGRCKVDLYYNRSIRRGGRPLGSYSVELCPDFTLMVHIGGRIRVINFDAKYKLKLDSDKSGEDDDVISTDYWHTDIHKMHTYRDAIYDCWGAYVLYPGTESNWYSKTYLHDICDDDIPSVGVIPLMPGIDDHRRFTEVLFKILNLIAGIEERGLLIDYMG